LRLEETWIKSAERVIHRSNWTSKNFLNIYVFPVNKELSTFVEIL